ncbi:double-strand break repair helicase AddA [Loktanella sp. IMCC34160]|uniref:double-strand break repair helicase AddA n=1 Tax=Loktanella sp. IMCC34160 TaxID=2510646 RepID=UPI00101D41DA|nr:double-strand break repair helicase AddA [Loktanella sp. IMCC34160]RYG91311.1 double-strand break repair helicase AddA [Loktanella sp. IMCC34160]
MTGWNEATIRQIEAADPERSTWLTANAGSGKTRVLTNRVARLLLNGVSPQNILCLTYTKAAASEMQNRLFESLGKWAMKDDGALNADLRDLGVGRVMSPEDLAHARTLFAKAIETPGGLKIQTIHSFCSSILRRFPLEAGVSPAFAEMEDRDAERLRMEVLDQMAEGSEAPVLLSVLGALTDQTLPKLLAEIMRWQDAFSADVTDELIAGWFGLTPSATSEEALNIAFIGGEKALAEEIAEIAAGTTKTYKDFAASLLDAVSGPLDLAALNALFGLLLYATDKTSKSRNFPQSKHTKAVAAFEPVIDDLHAWMDRTEAALQHLRAVNAYTQTRALYDFARAFIPAYEARKLARGVLDFDDLIRKTRALLTERAVAQWVLFKLDGGIDHILVDEAQDTSPVQWDVIRALADEFGSGSDGRDRTIFVVGDKKQSIYSFQGADPDELDRMQAHFEEELDRAGKQLRPETLQFSFRSAVAILGLVDQTFKGDWAEGVDRDIFHRAFKDDMPGRVDLWPIVDPPEKPEQGKWTDPVDRQSPDAADVVLARNVASTIKSMIGQPIPSEIGNTGTFELRPITEGDIMVLVQRRSALFSNIIKECKSLGLRVAGADRLKLNAELAVKDILALLRFLALPEDSLSLAAALKSPLFGWTEQQLFTLAKGRPKGRHLWQVLRERSADHAQTFAILTDLRRQADFLRPYDLIARALTRHRGRQSLIARLGDEAEDGIDALLSKALAYERGNTPSLTGFLAWIDGDEEDIKRQMDSAGDRLRVMTVHGSKGLEAPIVILPDTADREIRDRGQLLPTGTGGIVWRPKTDAFPAVLDPLKEATRAAEERERRRLLYVAMTRAEKWLIVAAAGKSVQGSGGWHDMVSAAFGRDGIATIDIDTPAGPGRRHQTGDWDGLPRAEPREPSGGQDIAHAAFPPLDDTPIPAKPLSPSDLGGAKVLAAETEGLDEDTAKLRGTLIHRLLEHLPALAPDRRGAVGQAIIDAEPDAVLVPDAADLIGMVIRLLEDPDLSALFGADALSEVEVVATLPELGGRQIRGAIDLLIVGPDRVRVIDFKSNRVVPNSSAEVPEGLMRQMGAYVAALHQIYPDKVIDPAILWVSAQKLMPLEESAVTAALLRADAP